MSLIFRYSDPRGLEEPSVTVALGSNVRFGTLGVALSAEVGDPAMSTIEIDDPGGLYDFQGLRAFQIVESSAGSNNTIIGQFAIQDREVRRSPERSSIVGADRLWSMDLTDYNWHLGKRILVDGDANRPAETPGDRIRWLLNNAAHINLNDYGHVTYPTTPTLEATDYRGQHPGDLLADCAVEGQYNFWCDYNQAHGKPELFFIDPNDATDTYAASITISNVLSDVDMSLTFPPYEDAVLRRSPSRIAYGVYLPYANGAVYVRKDSTGQQFGLLDQAAPMSNVKSSTRATRIANRFLNDHDEESDRISCSIKVPAAQVNDARHGQLIQARFSHFPGYEEAQVMRILRRTVSQEFEGGKDFYRIGLELSPLDPPVAVGDAPGPGGDYAGAVFAGLQRAYNSSSNILGFDGSFNPGHEYAGWPTQADTGPVTVNESVHPYLTITVSEPMTVRIHARAQGAGVYIPAVNRTLNITVNGAVVGTDSQSTATGFDGWTREVDLRNYHLDAGDVVSATGTLCTEWGNSGTGETYLVVVRGDFTIPTYNPDNFGP